MRKRIPTYHEDLIERLRNPQYAMGYLNATLEDDDKGVFLLALRNVAEACGGVSKISRKAKISREHIYRMLSDKGNPEFATLQLLVEALGFNIFLELRNNKNKVKKAA